LLHEDFRAEFPQSGEQFNREQFLAMNRSYPGDWTIHLRDVFKCEGRAVTEIEVEFGDRIDRAISLFWLEGGKLISLREYWPEPFPVPGWRVALFSTKGAAHEEQ
jgi:hypothetical protein